MNFTKHKIDDQNGLKGKITITTFKLPEGNMQALLLDQFLMNARKLNPFVYMEAIEELRSLCKIRQYVFYNQVVSTGRQVFARLLINDTTYTGEINFGALGTSNTAVVDGDTELVTEVARKGIASRSRTTDSVTIDFYYSKSDTNGTYEEFGSFIDGTASVDTGQLFNRVLTGGWTKSASEAMTVSLQLDINSA